MKVLFVCRSNVGRSQMAEALYNSLTSSTDAMSAGTHVDKPGQSLIERQKLIPNVSFAIDVMNDVGVPIAKHTTTQLTKEMLQKYDVVINMTGKRYTPRWLSSSPNSIYWKIRDPMGRSYQLTAKTRDQIKQKVTQLIMSGSGK